MPTLLEEFLADQQEGYQPFTGQTQTQRARCFCQILIDGTDVTNWLAPYLISVRVRDAGTFEAWVEVDDRDARLSTPGVGGGLAITLGWRGEASRKVFSGWISDVEHGFGRASGGRRMWVHGMGHVETQLHKTLFQTQLGNGAPPGMIQGPMFSFNQMANLVSGKAGTYTVVGPTYANLMRDYWLQDNESAQQWHSRMADELGAKTRLEDNHFVFWNIQDYNPSTVTARWGDNLIGWRVKPSVARTLWDFGEQQWYDHMASQWVKVFKSFGEPSPWTSTAIAKLPTPANSPNEAQQQVDGMNYKEAWIRGEGRIIINGEPNAQFLGTITLTGARPGVNGTYRIDAAEHTYSRQGYVTVLEVWPMAISDTHAGVTPPQGSLPAPAPNIQ